MSGSIRECLQSTHLKASAQRDTGFVRTQPIICSKAQTPASESYQERNIDGDTTDSSAHHTPNPTNTRARTYTNNSSDIRGHGQGITKHPDSTQGSGENTIPQWFDANGTHSTVRINGQEGDNSTGSHTIVNRRYPRGNSQDGGSHTAVTATAAQAPSHHHPLQKIDNYLCRSAHNIHGWFEYEQTKIRNLFQQLASVYSQQLAQYAQLLTNNMIQQIQQQQASSISAQNQQPPPQQSQQLIPPPVFPCIVCNKMETGPTFFCRMTQVEICLNCIDQYSNELKAGHQVQQPIDNNNNANMNDSASTDSE